MQGATFRTHPKDVQSKSRSTMLSSQPVFLQVKNWKAQANRVLKYTKRKTDSLVVRRPVASVQKGQINTSKRIRFVSHVSADVSDQRTNVLPIWLSEVNTGKMIPEFQE